MKSLFDYFLFRIHHFFDFKQKRLERYWSEHWLKKEKKSKEAVYYIIRRNDICGLFSVVNSVMGNIEYALEKGYIPVVDMKNCPNAYLPSSLLGKENSWEYFFEQPFSISVDDALAQKNVLLGSGALPNHRPDDHMVFFNNENEEMLHWRILFKERIRIRSDILEDIDYEWNQMVSPNDRVLGVKVRGTDYVKQRPKNHPVQPEICDVLKKVHEVMDEYSCNKLFVGTEDETYYKIFENEFGHACITNRCEYVEYKSGNIAETRINRQNDEYLQGKEYITTLVMLAKSNCFIGTRNSGSVAVMYMTEGFEYQYIFDLGKY